MAATGRVDIGQVAVETGQEIEEILELQIPGICEIKMISSSCLPLNIYSCLSKCLCFRSLCGQ